MVRKKKTKKTKKTKKIKKKQERTKNKKLVTQNAFKTSYRKKGL